MRDKVKFNKYILSSAFCLLTIASANAAVDIEGGVKLWFVDSDYQLDNAGSEDYGSSLGATVDLDVRHIMPLVPNFNFRVNYIDDDTRYTDLKFTHVDLAAYYNLFEISPFTIDLGAGVKIGEFDHETLGTDIEYENVVPYVLGRAKVDIIGTGLSVGADVRFIDLPFSDDTLMLDSQFGVTWNLGDYIIGSEVQAGYRYFMYRQDTNVSDETETTIKGPYLGIGLKF